MSMNSYPDFERGPNRRTPEVDSPYLETSPIEKLLAEYRDLRRTYYSQNPDAQNSPYDEVIEGLEAGNLIPEN